MNARLPKAYIERRFSFMFIEIGLIKHAVAMFAVLVLP